MQRRSSQCPTRNLQLQCSCRESDGMRLGRHTWIRPDSPIRWKTGQPQVPAMPPPWLHASHTRTWLMLLKHSHHSRGISVDLRCRVQSKRVRYPVSVFGKRFQDSEVVAFQLNPQRIMQRYFRCNILTETSCARKPSVEVTLTSLTTLSASFSRLIPI